MYHARSVGECYLPANARYKSQRFDFACGGCVCMSLLVYALLYYIYIYIIPSCTIVGYSVCVVVVDCLYSHSQPSFFKPLRLYHSHSFLIQFYLVIFFFITSKKKILYIFIFTFFFIFLLLLLLLSPPIIIIYSSAGLARWRGRIASLVHDVFPCQ